MLLRLRRQSAAGASPFVFGRYTPSFKEEQDQARIIANALKASVPVVSATTVSVDPGPYVGKLVDVVMNVTTGGVSKSGKSVYLQETPGGMSLVFFESAFEHFGGANGIAPRFLGKTVKVWGTNRQFQDCISLVVFAPREHQSAVCNTLPLFWRRTWQNRPNTPFFAARNPAGGVARRCCGWSHPCRDGLTTAPIVNT